MGWILLMLAAAVSIFVLHKMLWSHLERINTVVECPCGHVIGAHVTGQGCIQCACKENP